MANKIMKTPPTAIQLGQSKSTQQQIN